MNMTLGTRNRSRRGRAVERASLACAGVAGEALMRRLAEEAGAPAELPCVERRLRADGEALGRARERLEAADAVCCAVRSQMRALRRRRDQATRELYREMGRVRRAVKTAVGAERLWEHLPKGDTRREPWRLITQAGHALQLLADGQQPLDVEGTNGERIRGPELVSRLRSLIARGEEALRAVAKARRRDEAALTAKQRATAALDRCLKETAHRLETVLDAGGLYSLAGAVRPWTGRRGRPPKEKPVDLYPDLVARAMADMPASETAPATAKVVGSTRRSEALTPKVESSTPQTAGDTAIDRNSAAPTGDSPRIERFRRRQRATHRRSPVTSRRRRSFDSRCPSREKSKNTFTGRVPAVEKIEKRPSGQKTDGQKFEKRPRGLPPARAKFVRAFRGLRIEAANRLIANTYKAFRAR